VKKRKVRLRANAWRSGSGKGGKQSNKKGKKQLSDPLHKSCKKPMTFKVKKFPCVWKGIKDVKGKKLPASREKEEWDR